MSHPLRKHLNWLCHENKDGIQVAIAFKSGGPPIAGALRFAPLDGSENPGEEIYQLAGPGQTSKDGPVMIFSHFFAADAVERIVTMDNVAKPEIYTPKGSGGIVIPG